jgi:hypothetical protein
VKAGFGKLHSEEKTETPCLLFDKYGHVARNCRLRNSRFIRPYKDDDRMYMVDRRLEPREGLLWEGTRVCVVVTCSFANPASPTTIVRYKEMLGSNREIQNRGFLEGGCAFVRTKDIFSTYYTTGS